MSDFTYQTFWACESLLGSSTKVGDYVVSYSSNDGWHCTCKGFQFRKKCKHIDSINNNNVCHWCQEWDEGDPIDGPDGEKKCPQCGGPVFAYKSSV